MVHFVINRVVLWLSVLGRLRWVIRWVGWVRRHEVGFVDGTVLVGGRKRGVDVSPLCH